MTLNLLSLQLFLKSDHSTLCLCRSNYIACYFIIEGSLREAEPLEIKWDKRFIILIWPFEIVGTGKERSLSSSASSASAAELMSRNNWLVWKIQKGEHEMRRSRDNWNPHWPLLLPSFYLCHMNDPWGGWGGGCYLSIEPYWHLARNWKNKNNPKILKQRKRWHRSRSCGIDGCQERQPRDTLKPE